MSVPRRPLVHAKPRVLDGFQWGAKRGLDPQIDRDLLSATGSELGLLDFLLTPVRKHPGVVLWKQVKKSQYVGRVEARSELWIVQRLQERDTGFS
jgi:hypothetical protein